jgi:hypothetical protein
MDVTQLYRARNQRQITQAGGAAAAMLSGAPIHSVPDITPIAEDDRDAYYATHVDDHVAPPAQSQEAPLAATAAIAAATPPVAKADTPAYPADTRASPTALEPIYQLLNAMNIERALFDAYAKKKWGSWQSNPKGVDKVLADVTAGGNDPAAYRGKLNSEVNEFA